VTSELPYGAQRKASEARPTHSNNDLLKSFTKRSEKGEEIYVSTNHPPSTKNSALIMYDCIEFQSQKLNNTVMRHSMMNLQDANNLVDNLDTKK
jgi:hypothetical protein